MEKIVITTLKGLSTVVYILIFVLVFSLPVIFIYQAFQPPVFILESVQTEEDFTGDEVISANEAEDWKKIEYNLIAGAGKFSPYSFYIEEFGLSSELLPDKAAEVKIVIDSPIYCTRQESDKFTLTLYVRGADNLENFAKYASFKAATYEKSFGEFSLKFVDGKAKIFK